eukprot:Blabericola_migrator_1__2376@NODE_1667_length_4051_cov_30_506275_g1083_i0_p3_GENE_NODE_1667_length_4051_cov_30_506275_g1083_i0NODE_1667_length_4051_cov_30_506275_g1083_i0_p3_ORF_typecomplete_len198_score15_66FUSC_2/PF13515_6/0_0056FUSC_2/PF13515_6/2_8e03Acyl_transf_3/PF01757_22/0_0094DUF998/PF06197_13/0_052DUF998/PF06197_13/1_9e02Bax1I/PF01027_20/0_02Ndc1_Nup/PF09531_10/0_017DUF368/PF04018_13/0_043Peptidase_U4/PF03419_13/0_051Fst_toxin/PF13955_6/0_24FecCD/PF01032_18/0_035FecCD/PF01032_18/6_1e03_
MWRESIGGQVLMPSPDTLWNDQQRVSFHPVLAMLSTYTKPTKLLFVAALIGTISVSYVTVMSWSAGQPNPIVVGAIITLLAGPVIMLHCAYDQRHPTMYHLSSALAAVGAIYMGLSALFQTEFLPKPTAPPGKTRPPPPPIYKQLPPLVSSGLEKSLMYTSLVACGAFIVCSLLLLKSGTPDVVQWEEFRSRRKAHR